MSKNVPTRIFVRLLDEGTDVWRPTEAELQPDGTYLVLGEVPEDETWEYPPGSLVNSEMKTFQSGTSALTAVSPKFSWLKTFRYELAHIADEEYQRRVWFGLDPKYIGSPDETMSDIYDGLYVEDILSGKIKVDLTPEQMEVLREFMAVYGPYIDAWPDWPDLPTAQEVLDDPKWKDIVAAAQRAEAAFAEIDRQAPGAHPSNRTATEP